MAKDGLAPGGKSAADRKRRVLFVLPRPARLSYHQSTIEHLCLAGHDVTLVYCKNAKMVAETPEAQAFVDYITRFEAQFPNLEVVRPSKKNPIQSARAGRGPAESLYQLRSYASYLARYGARNFYSARWAEHLAEEDGKYAKSAWRRMLLGLRFTRRRLDRRQRELPPDPTLVAWLETRKPDVVVASPANLYSLDEADFVRAAQALGIPTAVPVLSWDNLTTKGLLPLDVSMVLAWNRGHAREAEAIHGIPADAVVVTGAPFFDKWFVSEADPPGPDHRRRSEVSSARPYVLYLGSTKNIAASEAWLVRRIAGAMLAHPALSDARLLVRPHPSNNAMLEELTDVPGVVPSPGTLPYSEDAADQFRRLIAGAACVVGVNTSGMIDAVICGRPCFSVRTEQYTDTHLDSAHFRAMTESGAIGLASEVPQLLEWIAASVAGRDPTADARRRFVDTAIRPRGPDRAAGGFAAQAIALLSAGQSPREISRYLDDAAAAKSLAPRRVPAS